MGCRVSGYTLCLESFDFSQCWRGYLVEGVSSTIHRFRVCIRRRSSYHCPVGTGAAGYNHLEPVRSCRHHSSVVFLCTSPASTIASSGCFFFGDFNTVLSPTVHRWGGAPCARADGFFRDLRWGLTAGDFIDVCRRFFPCITGFTWRKRDGTYSSRIDLVLVPSSEFSTVKTVKVIPCHLSDHSAVRVHAHEIFWGKEYWKRNSSLL